MPSKKASTLITGIGNDICSPFFDSSGLLHIVHQNSGAIKSITSTGIEQLVCYTGGQPSGAVYSAENILYVSDFGHAAVLAIQRDGQQELVVGVYEDKPLKGPSSINITNGDVFFTDSGAFGETGFISKQFS
jgi:aspartate beta-hydroxylase